MANRIRNERLEIKLTKEKSSYKIRYQSDKLCEDNNLSVIDEHYESYKTKDKTKGKSFGYQT